MNHALPLGCSRRLPVLARLRLADHRSERLEAQGRPERLEIQAIQTSVNIHIMLSYIYMNIYMAVSRWLKPKAHRRSITERTLKIHALGHTADMSAV